VLVSPVATSSDRGAASQLLSMRDEQQVARSLPVARIVIERFASSATPEQLLRHVTVEVPGGSQILRITCADWIRSTARTSANAFATAYLAYRKDAVRRPGPEPGRGPDPTDRRPHGQEAGPGRRAGS
jgi:capsular polysaccharide biosynthesis protein